MINHIFLKLKAVITSIILCSSSLLFAQSACEMTLEGNRMIGKCESNFFTEIEIYLDKHYNKIDTTTLFQALPKDGFITIHSIKIKAKFVITERAGFPQIMFKPNQSRVGWYTFDSLYSENETLHFIIDTDPDVPFLDEDLQILHHAKGLLKDSLNWNRNDDRRCEDDVSGGKYSFFCALQTASIAIVGEYNHRNAVMQLMRHLIEEEFPERKWEHRFKDFNNMPETTFRDIIEIFDSAEKIIEAKLK